MGGNFEVSQLQNKLGTCGDLFDILRPGLQIIFIFSQMYFIFLNQKMNIYKRKFVSRLGLMHLFATNICILLRVVIAETHRDMIGTDILDRYERSSESNISEELINEQLIAEDSLNSSESSIILLCDNQIIYNLKEDSSPYLYPCLAQFCLVCSVVIFVMWSSVAREHQQYQLFKESRPIKNTGVCGDFQKYSVDCNGSSTGLFCGIIMVVIMIVSLILLFVFNSSTLPELAWIGEHISSISKLLLYSVTSIAVFTAIVKTKTLWYDASRTSKLDHILLLISQMGVLLKATCNLVAQALSIVGTEYWPLISLFTEATIILQTLLQSVFILDVSCRFAATNSHVKHKPGRQLVTFLLVCNLALWVVNIIEIKQPGPLPVGFFTLNWAWPVLSHITSPLSMLYRFYSAVCLYEIWRTSYKYKVTNVDFI